jgi:hypothetical protein
VLRVPAGLCWLLARSAAETPALFSFSLDEVAQFASAHMMHVMYCTDDPRSVVRMLVLWCGRCW